MARQEKSMQKDEYYAYLLHHHENKGFINNLGLHVTKLGDGFASGEMKITEDLMNPLGIVHGGALAGFADTLAGCAIYSLGLRCVTSDCQITYLRPATGLMLTCEAKVRKAGQNLSVVNAVIYNDRHEEVVITTFQFAVSKNINLVD